MAKLGVPARILARLVVEKTTIDMPTGIDVAGPVCTDPGPDDCCPCPCTLADTIWLEVATEDVDCACVMPCVRLDKNDEDGAWYSAVVTLACGGGSYRFRLRCEYGDYELDLVDDANDVVLAGTVTFGGCSPLALSASFDDTEVVVCDGAFTATVRATSCEVTNSCCPGGVPWLLWVTFESGACAGTYAITWQPGYTAWRTLDAGPTMTLTCEAGPVWNFEVDLDADGPDTATCDPFLLEFTGFASVTCGTVNITISEVHP